MAIKEKVLSYTTSQIHSLFDKQFENLKENISGYMKYPDFSLLDKAYNYAIDKHEKQVRRSGDPYFDHLFNVAYLLTELKLDVITVSCGFLHDVLEDTDVTIEEFTENFGQEVTDLVNGVTKITSLSANSQKLKQAENFRKMILSSANDLRVLLIKFADRLHNMRTLNHMPPEKRTRIATETKDVYAPLAHRFGLQKVKIELEDLSLKYLDSESYFFLKRKIEETQDQRNNYINLTINPIEKELQKANVKAEIYGRPKHFYSIYNKMMKRQKPFEEIYDLLAIRIIVKKIEECYFTLGIVHSLYIPVADRFKDYIATPKINGYQSLHTTIIGPNGQMVEIQIRSNEMHVHAEEGIAAHWRYKTDSKSRSKSSSSDDALNQHVQWLKQFIDRQDETDSEDFMDNLKIDLFQDEVFVYTPLGDLFTLPKGSTPIDFAFHIHSNLGLECSGAKVNGQIRPLKFELKSGDVVQIISSKTQHPKKEWLNIVKTSKARHYIKRWIKQNEMDQFKSIGEQIISDIVKRLDLKSSEIDYEKLMNNYNFKSIDTFLAAIGRSQISINSLEYQLKPQDQEKEKKEKVNLKETEDSTENIIGIENILISYGKCCNPIPGDLINGYVTAGRGITIHRINCKNTEKLKELHPERFIFLNWNYLSHSSEKYQVKILISAKNRNFLIRDISQALSKVDIGISAIEIKSDQNDLAYGYINVFIDSNETLNQVMNILRSISSVNHVERDELSSADD